MREIAAAVDLSPIARRVADRARIVAEEREAVLTLVHVREPPDVELPDEMLERVRLYQHGLVEDLLTWINARASCPVEIQIRSGNAAVELVRRSRQTELLVTGTSSVDHTRVGPLTTRLARKAHCPVLSVRRRSRLPYRRVIAAVDLSDPSARAIELAMDMAPCAESITAVASLSPHAEMLLSDAGVNPEQLDALRRDRLAMLGDRLDKFTAGWGDRVVARVLDGPPAESVAELARRRRADLVVAANRGAAGTNMVLLGSTVEAMLSSVPCDVAIARAPGRFRRP